MKQTYRSFLLVMAVAAMLLNACGAVAAHNLPVAPVAAKVDASIIAYTGVIESMDGNQWVVNGQTLVVDPAVVRDGPFQVGDTVKIEGIVNPDGSFTVSSIEAPDASDLAGSSGNDNANVNDNENTNDDSNINDNDNDDDEDDNANDDNSNDDDLDDDDSNDNGNGGSGHGKDNGHDDDGQGGDDDSHDDDGQGGEDDSGDDD